MKRTIYTILQIIVFSAAIFFSIWSVEEATTLHSHSWRDLVYVWAIVLCGLAVLSVVFRKKITSMEGLPMTILILLALSFAGALIDTYYANGILHAKVIQSVKVNQSILCLSIWAVTICLFLYFRKLTKKQEVKKETTPQTQKTTKRYQI